MGVANKVQREFLSQPVEMTPESFTEKHSFLLFDTTPVNLLGRDLISRLKGLIRFASNGDLTLEFPDQPEPDLLCSCNLFLIQKRKNSNKSPLN